MPTILDRMELPAAATARRTSTVGEPSVARVDGNVLYTGNWYAASSTDDGVLWRHLDPFTFFPPADDGFCCDQTVIYDPGRDLHVWLLQYSRTSSGNTLRLAVKRGASLADHNDWFWWDLVPSQVDPDWTNEWFDYNHAALSDNFLYVVTNAFQTSANGPFTRCVAFRFPLDDLAGGTNLGVELFQTQDFSMRCTQGAQGVMYLGTHAQSLPHRVRVFRWAEDESQPTSTDVAVTAWRGGNGYFAPGPDGNNWLNRCDPRITAGWVASDLVGFAWSVDRQGTRPQPHVRVVRIDEASMTLFDEPDIWSREFATAYPDVSPNLDGEVGISLFFGGGQDFPSHAVGDWQRGLDRWDLQASKLGTDGPVDGKWGDYVTCRPAHSSMSEWSATGFVLDGGDTRDFIRPILVRFTI